MSTWTQEEMEHALQKIAAKAATDQDFRQLALTNPQEAIKQLTGQEAPADFPRDMIEQALGEEPSVGQPDGQTDELSDDELDQVAGGRGRGHHRRGYRVSRRKTDQPREQEARRIQPLQKEQ